MKHFRLSLNKLASPPLQERDYTTITSRLLYLVVGLSFTYSLLLILLNGFIVPSNALLFLSACVGMGITLGTLALVRAGYIGLACWLATGSFWFMTTSYIIAAGETGAPAFLGYVTLIVMTGLLFGVRGGVTVTGINAAASGLIVYANIIGVLPPASFAASPLSQFLHTAYQFIAVIALHVATSQSIRDTLTIVQQELSNRSRSEEALRERERTYKSIYDHAYQFVGLLDTQGNILQANKTSLDFVGVSEADILGKPIWDTPWWPKAGETREHVKRSVKEAATGRFVRFETINLDAHGRIHHIDFSLQPLLNEQGTVALLIPEGRNITDRKLAEEALRESEERYRFFVETSNDLIFIAQEGMVKYPNRKAVQLLGYSAEELQQKEILAIVHPDDRRIVYTNYRTILDRKNRNSVFTVRIMTKVGEIVWLEVSAVYVLWERKTALLNFARDITEQKRLESRLIQSQKMEAIGTLAGGIAHDFNNILTAIIGSAQILQMKMGSDHPLHDHVQILHEAAQRASGLTHGLLAFSRKQILNPQPASLNDVVARTGKLIKRLIPEDIRVREDLTADRLQIMADSNQISQVIINLVVNARDAMPGGGEIVVKTEIRSLDEEFIQNHGYGKIASYAVLSVSDTGIGMDAETREKIFEPFFTTKDIGKGTGLGLAMVYGTIQQHDGYITVSSEMGKGTKFHCYFPLISLSSSQDVALESIPFAGGSETILLADDDVLVRTIMKRVLTQHGYRIIEAEDGEDAISQYRQHSSEVDLVILDVVMPKKNGREVLEEIWKVRHGVKAIFISGYDSDLISRRGILDSGLTFLAKPHQPRDLVCKVRELLDGVRK